MADPSFEQLAVAYKAAQAAWRIRSEVDDSADAPECHAYEDADSAVFRFPCRTIEEVQAKARLILSEDLLYDSVLNSTRDGQDVLVIFLRSLAGEGGAQ